MIETERKFSQVNPSLKFQGEAFSFMWEALAALVII
jgi:hypothetical protein